MEEFCEIVAKSENLADATHDKKEKVRIVIEALTRKIRSNRSGLDDDLKTL